MRPENHANIVGRSPELRTAVWLLAWLGFIAVNFGICAIDWAMRDHSTHVQPMPGGLPDALSFFLICLTLGALFVTVFFAMPKRWAFWLRLALAAVQVAVAYGALAIALVYYAVSSGIDTL